MAIRRTLAEFSDDIATADIADDAITGGKLANDIAISTTGNIATTYVQSHFVGQDDTKDARLLADEWTQIRRERTRLLADTDHLALSAQTLTAGMTTYRQELRDLPSDQSSKTKYSDITWPTKS